MRWLFHFATPTDQKIFYCKRVKDVETFCVLRVGAVSQRLIATGEQSGLRTRIAANWFDSLARFLPDSASSETGGQGRKLFSRSFLPFFRCALRRVNPPGANQKRKINMKPQSLIHILMGIVCVGLLPTTQAVIPSPDGGYPGFTTAEGTNALQSLTTGSANTAVGWYSLFSSADANFNTAVGAGTLTLNTGDSNTAVGTVALFLNTTGYTNTATGTSALFANTTGIGNTANGYQALYSNTTGSYNTGIGREHCIIIPPASQTRLSVSLRSGATRPRTATRPLAILRCSPTPPARTIPASVASLERISPKALTTCVWVHFPGLLSPPAVTLSRSAPCLVSTVFLAR